MKDVRSSRAAMETTMISIPTNASQWIPSNTWFVITEYGLLCSRLDNGVRQRSGPALPQCLRKFTELLDVANFRQPDFQVDLIKDLALDKDANAMIKAFSHHYTMQSETENTWSADFVRNKGEGQIFLLHGKPGLGKTTTAECVAELTRRPLLSLTCGDLGIEPLAIERELMRWLTLATSWEAVLLLDEADVCLESRISQDLQRNTLVSIFLRALEYYQGLLFLTTNRVGTFDDAFVSRIHVVIHYPEFANVQRGQIWEHLLQQARKRARKNIMFTQRNDRLCARKQRDATSRMGTGARSGTVT